MEPTLVAITLFTLSGLCALALIADTKRAQTQTAPEPATHAHRQA